MTRLVVDLEKGTITLLKKNEVNDLPDSFNVAESEYVEIAQADYTPENLEEISLWLEDEAKKIVSASADAIAEADTDLEEMAFHQNSES